MLNPHATAGMNPKRIKRSPTPKPILRDAIPVLTTSPASDDDVPTPIPPSAPVMDNPAPSRSRPRERVFLSPFFVYDERSVRFPAVFIIMQITPITNGAIRAGLKSYPERNAGVGIAKSARLEASENVSMENTPRRIAESIPTPIPKMVE